MALHADVIAPGGWKLGGIDYCAAAIGPCIVGPSIVSPSNDVRRSGAVAALARDSPVSERRLRVTILGARQRRLHTTHMAVQTARVSRQVQRNFARRLIGRSHIPSM